MTKKDTYPKYVCRECALKGGGTFPKTHLATFHYAICPCCGARKAVTEPCDYNYPSLESKFEYKPLNLYEDDNAS